MDKKKKRGGGPLQLMMEKLDMALEPLRIMFPSPQPHSLMQPSTNLSITHSSTQLQFPFFFYY